MSDRIQNFIIDDFLEKLSKALCARHQPANGVSIFALLRAIHRLDDRDSVDCLLKSYSSVEIAAECETLIGIEKIDEETRKTLRVFSQLQDPSYYLANPNPGEEVVDDEPLSDTPPSPVTPLRTAGSLPRIAVPSPLLDMYSAKGIKPVKKEYFRCQYIRAAKKTMRALVTEKVLTKGLCQVDTKNKWSMQMWTELGELVKTDQNFWEGVSQPSLVEGRSFNNRCCRNFFLNPNVRCFHYKFCDLVFDRCPADLCTNVKVKCCLCKSHTASCVDLWVRLKEYTKFGMLEELSFCRAELEAESG